METVRIRLVFEDRRTLSKSQRSMGLNRSWLLLKPQQHPTFSHLAAHLVNIFDLRQSCSDGLLLCMDGFVLPPFESTSILKDKDIISVKKKGGPLNEIFVNGIMAGSSKELEVVEMQPVHTNVPLASGEYEKEVGGDESESEEDAECLEDTSRGKKRKASRKIESLKKKKCPVIVPDGVEKDNQIESNSDKGVLSKKISGKRVEKESQSKRKQKAEDTQKCVEKCSSGSESTSTEKSDRLEENGRTEDMSHTTNTTKKVPSRSARRKKAKRQWLRAMAKIGKKKVVPLSEGPLKRKQRRDKAEKKEVIGQSKVLIQWDQTKDEKHESEVDREKSNEKCDEEDEVVPVVIRPGHIRFEPMEEGEVLQQSPVFMETFHWNGITSKRKGQKWGTEKSSSAGRHEHEDFDQVQTNLTTTKIEIPVSNPVDFDKLLPLSSLPKEADVIAYRLVELSSTWTPELSPYRVGKVLWYKPESKAVKLMPVPEYPVILEKQDEDDTSAPQPDNSIYNEDGSLEIDFSSLVDVRIVEHSNTDDSEAVGKISENPLTDKNISHVLPGNNHEQKQSSKAGNGEVNLWDHFSEAVDAKKAQLQEENSWIKGSPVKSSWSYRALRGSALGPTIARLRSNNDI